MAGHRGWQDGAAGLQRIAICALMSGWALTLTVAAEDIRFEPAPELKALDEQVSWSSARLIAAQDSGRHKTLESFARESMQAMIGAEHLPGLSPLASLLEWQFNSQAYADAPLILIRDRGLRLHLAARFADEPMADRRERISNTGRLSPRELADPGVQQRIRELEPRFEMGKAIGRVRHAQLVALHMDSMVRIVPKPEGDHTELWATPRELTPNLPDEVLAAGGHTREGIIQQIGPPVRGIAAADAMVVVSAWSTLGEAWRTRDAAQVQAQLDRLAELLPRLAPPGVYADIGQRVAEARYYQFGKFTSGYYLYFLALMLAIWALITQWRVAWWIALLTLVAAAGIHCYGVGMRWYILERIPVANMFEAITSSALVGVLLAIVLECFFRWRIFLIAGAAAGYAALLTGHMLVPGTLQPIMGILDDLMLRIHTTLIIASYALVFMGGVIAIVYLFGYYLHNHAAQSVESGVMAAVVGAALYFLSSATFHAPTLPPTATGVLKLDGVALAFGIAAALSAIVLGVLIARRAHGSFICATTLLTLACFVKTVGNHDFVSWTALVLSAGGLAWAAMTAIGVLVRNWRGASLLSVAAAPRVALAGGVELAERDIAPELQARSATPAQREQRPVLAGGAPGDEGQPDRSPLFLQRLDWCHLIILNMVFVMLFVGTVLGAVWADYSWGRPWGWDPKEVFALNTWLIYVALIHMRFVVRQRGLWTAWLSLVGCGMMIFNWFFINFFIVGLHSYA